MKKNVIFKDKLTIIKLLSSGVIKLIFFGRKVFLVLFVYWGSS